MFSFLYLSFFICCLKILAENIYLKLVSMWRHIKETHCHHPYLFYRFSVVRMRRLRARPMQDNKENVKVKQTLYQRSGQNGIVG